MTRGMKFDPAQALAKLRSGEVRLDLPRSAPADERECSDPRCVDGFIQLCVPEAGGPDLMAPCPRCAERNAQKASRATLKAAGLGETIYEVRWDALDLSHESWQVAREYAEDAGALVTENQSLIFVGDYGRGKTQAATLILAHAAQAGHQVERVKWGQFVRRVRATYSRDSKLSEDDLISALVAPALLLLDDVGAADKHSDHNERLLTAVIDERYDRGRPLILTTNLGKDELEEHLGGRAFDRLWNNSDKVIFDGPNYRELCERPRAKGLAARIRDRVQARQQAAQAAD